MSAFIITATLAGIQYDKLWYQGGAVTALFCGICMVCGMIWIIFHLSGSYAPLLNSGHVKSQFLEYLLYGTPSAGT